MPNVFLIVLPPLGIGKHSYCCKGNSDLAEMIVLGMRCIYNTIRMPRRWVFVPEHSLSMRLLDLNPHGFDVVFCILLSRSWGDLWYGAESHL